MKKVYFFDQYIKKIVFPSLLIREFLDSFYELVYFKKIVLSLCFNKLIFLENIDIIKGLFFLEYVSNKRPKIFNKINYFYNGRRLFKLMVKVKLWNSDILYFFEKFFIKYFWMLKENNLEFFWDFKNIKVQFNSLSLVIKYLNYIPFFTEEFFEWPYQITMSCVLKNYKTINNCISLFTYFRIY